MKWFCHIIAFYLLALAGFPCADGGRAYGGISGDITVLKNASPVEQSHDHCTPLCQCSCCGSVVLAIKVAPSFLHSSSIPFDNSADYSYKMPFSADHTAVLFRPPKIMLG